MFFTHSNLVLVYGVVPMINYEFKIKDIISYESNNDIDILNSLQLCETDVLTDLIMMGSGCDMDEAIDILEKELQDRELVDIIKDIVWCLFGKQEIKEDTPVMKKDEYESLSNALELMFNQLQAVDTLSLSEFMNMSTRYMYRYADGVQKRYIISKNEELMSQYTNVSMLMSALSGKLKECPQLDDTGKIKKMSLQERIIALKNSRSTR